MRGVSVLAGALVLYMGRGAARSYDPSSVADLVYYAGVAYCDESSIESWDCGTGCTTVGQSGSVFVQTNASTYVQSYVTTRPDTGAALLSFRGTMPTSWKDWIKDNFDAFKITPVGFTGEVHQGFYDAYMSLKPQIMQDLGSLGARSVQVTGHSLGAAMASVAMYDLSVNEGFTILPSATFGQPRLGDSDFEASWSSMFGGDNVWRVTHNRDPVPHVPLEAMGFHHIPTEVWYTEDASSYQVCDGSGEDPNCSDSLDLDIDITDHLHYLNIPISGLCTSTSASRPAILNNNLRG